MDKTRELVKTKQVKSLERKYSRLCLVNIFNLHALDTSTPD